jgi:hypothetical protein
MGETIKAKAPRKRRSTVAKLRDERDELKSGCEVSIRTVRALLLQRDELLARLFRALDEAEARLEEVDLRTTALAIGQGNVSAALDRTEALTDKLESLESRAIVLEAAMAKRAKVTISRAIGLGGPALAWVKGDITTGRWAEVLTDWLNGKDRWVAEDVGLETWPEPPAWMGEDDMPW